jgi:DNA invertase Pin-like site-specific DNA recombinase
MKDIGYIRVSTEDQAREGISLDNQEAKIKAYATLNGLDLTEIIKDAGISGKTLNRPGIAKVLKMIEAREIEAIIVYKLDRLSRKTLDNLTLIESFDSNGIAFHSIMEKIDTKSAQGRFFLTILSALAQMERDLIAERTRDALAHKKTKREWTGRIPFGYRVEDCHLVEDPEAMRTIQKAKRMKTDGKSVRAISEALNLSLGYVHKVINTDLRKIKNGYSREYGPVTVQ